MIDVVETEYANATAEWDYMNECRDGKARRTMKERGRRLKGIDIDGFFFQLSGVSDIVPMFWNIRTSLTDV